MEASVATRPLTEADLLAFIADGQARRRAYADREWSAACDRVLDVIARAHVTPRQREEFVWGVWSLNEQWITDVEFAVRLLVRRGRKEGRLERTR